MKSTFAILFAAMLFAGTAFGQAPNFGVKGGLNVYTLHTNDNTEFNSETNFHAGLLAHFHVSPNFAIQPEVLFSGQGAKFDVGSVENKYKLKYINVPVMLQYMFNNGFRLEAGPQIGFLTSAKTEVGNASFDVKDDLNTIDFGVGGGIGYVSKSGFGVDARYNFGLTDITKSSAGSAKVQNRGLQVGVFYQFSHK